MLAKMFIHATPPPALRHDARGERTAAPFIPIAAKHCYAPERQRRYAAYATATCRVAEELLLSYRQRCRRREDAAAACAAFREERRGGQARRCRATAARERHAAAASCHLPFMLRPSFEQRPLIARANQMPLYVSPIIRTYTISLFTILL